MSDNIGKWSLILFDSEGGDYVRAYSKSHDTEVYLHEDWSIEKYFPSSLDENNGFNLFLSDSSKALPIFVDYFNCKWHCNMCGTQYSVVEHYPLHPEICKDCNGEG